MSIDLNRKEPVHFRQKRLKNVAAIRFTSNSTESDIKKVG